MATKQQQPDSPGGLYEVLSQRPAGQRTIHRVTAESIDAARAAVADALPAGAEVIDAAPVRPGG